MYFIYGVCIAAMLPFLTSGKVNNTVIYHAPATDTVIYIESDADFPNPERGFYQVAETYVGNYVPLNVKQLQNWRTLQQANNGNYKVYSSLVFRNIVLAGYTNKKLPQYVLHKISADFAAARIAGVKLVLRFCYTVTQKPGNCPEGFICPKYGDAPKNIVLQQIAQLKPLLRKNADIIACMQMGFVGTWGENFYSDYFGDPSPNGAGRLTDKNWADKAEVLTALLDALPKDRMVQVRTPQMKQRYVYGVYAPTSSAALTDAVAFTGANMARIGFHNDCFLSSANDYGTYDDYGNSSSPHTDAYTVLHAYAMADGKYSPVGGETCDDAYSPQNDCENAGRAQTEMRNMHYSFLNCSYNNAVNNDWQTGGCMDAIKRNLGYRLILRDAVFTPGHIKAGAQLAFTLNMQNAGYASPYNSRPVQLVMRNKSSNKEFVFGIDTDLRKWYTGVFTVNVKAVTPGNMPPGEYALFLYMPDAYPSIANRPEYAIRLANENVWEEATGYNSLNKTIEIK